MPQPGLRPERRAVCLAIATTALVAGCSSPSPPFVGPSDPILPTASPTFLAPIEPTPRVEPQARRLTEPGCCSRHWWSADGSRVLFIDDPPGDSPLGVYGVRPTGGEVEWLAPLDGEGLPAADRPPDAPPEWGGDAPLPAEAQNIRISRDGARAAWTTGSTLPVNIDRRQRTLWVIDGPTGSPRRLTVLSGGDLVGWAEGDQALIVTGRTSGTAPAGIWRLPLDGSPPSLRASVDRPRGLLLSPGGGWLAYTVAFDAQPGLNGLWVVGTSEGDPVRLPEFGSYRWAEEGSLVFVPYRPTSGELLIEVFDAGTRQVGVVAAEGFPGGVANNDWSVSPDGGWIVYRAAVDAALWAFPIRAP